MDDKELNKIAEALVAPFDADEVRWKPQAVSGSRALAVGYVTARGIMDRLDEVFGVAGWQTDYQVVEGGSVVCRLSCRFDTLWVMKSDVGGPSEQPDEGDRMKAAFSDALKRAAVQFGIGRYLYRLPKQWTDYDPKTKQFAKPPELPEWARSGINKQQAETLAATLGGAKGEAWDRFRLRYRIERLSELPKLHYNDALAFAKENTKAA